MIHILLSTYNGSTYLPAFLESIAQQTYTCWHIIVRDDGSSDNTVTQLQQWSEAHPNKITIYAEENIGCLSSFARLMQIANELQHTTHDYIMFADQDDVWLPHKIQHALEAIAKQESLHPNAPIVVCTNLTVVDQELNPIAPSMWEYAHIPAQLLASSDYLNIFNCATGCTMLFNLRALQASLPLHTQYAVMHDYWVALCTKHTGGYILPLEQSDILYRQHEGNKVGAYKYTPLFKRGWKYIKQSIQLNKQYYQQAKCVNNITWFRYLMLKCLYHFEN